MAWGQRVQWRPGWLRHLQWREQPTPAPGGECSEPLCWGSAMTIFVFTCHMLKLFVLYDMLCIIDEDRFTIILLVHLFLFLIWIVLLILNDFLSDPLHVVNSKHSWYLSFQCCSTWLQSFGVDACSVVTGSIQNTVHGGCLKITELPGIEQKNTTMFGREN